MKANASTKEWPDYGIDAPNVVRNLFLVGLIGLIVWGTTVFNLWSGTLVIPLPGLKVAFPLNGMGLGLGLGCTLMAVWMVWSSKVGKIRDRERLLQRVNWTGKEQVLDIGCGRGLMLIGAAKRLTTGRATGIDIWQTEDLSGNDPQATLRNAQYEGVANRIDIHTADMRKLPFADNSFDIVVSRAAIHNLYQVDDRAKAICEIARVLKPGGQALIEDIRHGQEYTAIFSKNGCTDIRNVESRIVSILLMLITFGSLRPATLMVRKSL